MGAGETLCVGFFECLSTSPIWRYETVFARTSLRDHGLCPKIGLW
jgi:hypothetical protein